MVVLGGMKTVIALNSGSKSPSRSEVNCKSSKVNGPVCPKGFSAGLSNGGLNPSPKAESKVGTLGSSSTFNGTTELSPFLSSKIFPGKKSCTLLKAKFSVIVTYSHPSVGLGTDSPKAFKYAVLNLK